MGLDSGTIATIVVGGIAIVVAIYYGEKSKNKKGGSKVQKLDAKDIKGSNIQQTLNSSDEGSEQILKARNIEDSEVIQENTNSDK